MVSSGGRKGSYCLRVYSFTGGYGQRAAGESKQEVGVFGGGTGCGEGRLEKQEGEQAGSRSNAGHLQDTDSRSER